ncbi:conidial yellow pigment biosynthesis polyketide synthase [Staphylotrichum tortipilum]|uniref:Conidial yellow pigment biosynthesis polyketide synthase n=1 Tax=Staphylotrichum tortipilum TaxID=2831512 RepID=A0AAN6MQ39_9PEZI|nr:conidial yellow pigment biosynthesis polyketide synthase [Staphylotrichum longicolle]
MGVELNDSWADRPAFLLFGDQSLDCYSFLADIFRQDTQGELTKAFLRQVCHALKRAVDSLPAVERGMIPEFRTLQQLNERYRGASLRHAGIDAALLSISQLAHYIDHAERNCGDITQPGRTFVVGLCSGLWAAAAVSIAPSLPDLVHIGTQTVLLAFKTGTYVHSIAQRLEPATNESRSWTQLLAGISHEEVVEKLDAYHTAEAKPAATRAYVSAVSASAVAISGPPSTLDDLVSKGVLPRNTAALPVHAPYHAPHLHSTVDVEKLLDLDKSDVQDAFFKTRPRSPLVSCATGALLPAADTKSLMKSIASILLNEPLAFSKVLDGCVEYARQFEDKSCLVLALGPNQTAPALRNALSNQAGLEVVLRGTRSVAPEDDAPTVGNHGSTGKCKLAIVGMAGRFPDAASHEKLWELLQRGLDVHREVPADRFDVKTHVDRTGKVINTSHTPYGCWIDEPGLFDPRFFNMSPREALQTDPMQRMALTTAYEALEMSGYVPNRTPSTRLDRIGTFYGQTSDDWREINAAQEVDTYFITGGVRAFGPGRINYHFGFSGPSLNIDTACSSSAAAMQVACTALWARDCDTAVVGGLSCMTNPDIFSGLSRGQFLSKTGPCATFDNNADGYCRGDGCASVVVKRLEDALAEDDRILAVILGTATNHSADAISITHPHGPTQSTLSRAILDEAGVDPHDVDYVEMHGTGTQAGDGTEMKSVTNVFAPADRKRPANRPLYLGTVKANVGHGEAASGVTALVKVLLMFQKNLIPPHVGIKAGSVMNLSFPKDLSERNVNIPFHQCQFKRKDGKPRRVFINNFSAAGGNTGLLLEDAPKRAQPTPDPRSHHVVTVTAKSKAAMIRNAERLVEWVNKNPDVPLSHIAYSMTARKMQHYWRMSVVGTDTTEVCEAIAGRLKQNLVPVQPEPPKVVMLFTGQGSHYATMGKELYENHSVFRKAIDEFDLLTRIHGLPSFLPLIVGSEPEFGKLSPVQLQLGLACFEMAIARLWASWGIRPAAVLGHSLGEYAALEVAGVLSASDAIYLVGARAQLLVDRCTAGTHSMLAVQASAEDVKGTLGTKMDGLEVACVNSPNETVLAGAVPVVDEVASFLTDAGLKFTQLRVPFAFHSTQVDVILDDFEKLARGVKFNSPSVPIISPLRGKVMDGEPISPAYLREHARGTVNFLEGLVSAQRSNTIDDKTVWLEMGPHPVCANLVKACFGPTTVAVASLRRKEQCYKTLSSSFATLHTAGLNINFNEYHRNFADSVRLLDLPSYSFDNKTYWLQYTGDWCLTKNRVGAGSQPKALEPVKPKLSTTTVHKITREEVKGDVAVVEIESDLCQEQLRNAVSGHVVNGAPLCPSSLYGDMAMTVCNYAYKLLRPAADNIGCNVAEMEVPKTLILDDSKGSHILRLTVTANAQLGTADLVFHTGEGARRTEHALCKVYYGNVEDWQSEFDRQAYLIKSRINTLMEAEKRGTASKIGRGLAYKLFTALVDYSPRYRGMEEVILDSAECEATAKVRFQTTEQDGQFHFSPYHIDSLCHISGFIINGTDAVDSREKVFISHGWGSMRFAEIPDPKKEYRTYIRMQPAQGGKVMVGDAYVFDGDRLIGVTGDIKFQPIPRRVLNTVLPPRGAAAAAAHSPVRPAPAAPAARAAASTAAKAAPPSKKKKESVTPSTIGKVNQRLKTVISAVMDILAAEIGCPLDELADGIAFNDLGVDSLMTLQVSGRIREELELDIHSNAFLDYPTVDAFKTYLAQYEKPGRYESVPSHDSDATSDGGSPEIESDSNVTTPPEESETQSVKDEAVLAQGDSTVSGSDLQAMLRNTIAQEMNVDVDEIVAAPDLANLGIDSLMSLAILGSLRERTGLDIPGDLFTNNQSLKDVERALGISDIVKKPAARKQAAAVASSPSPPPAALQRPLPRIGVEEPMPPKPPRPSSLVDQCPDRKASSVLLAGVQRTASKLLFLVPDGSGSPTSYTEVADVGGRWAVWGLFSPFMKQPSEYLCGVYGMATKFIQEIKRRQPKGPYSLGGWSAGGVIAYEMVNQLVKAGEEVENLIIIDAPCPVTIEPLPQGLHAWFAAIGLLGEAGEKDEDGKDKEKKIPEWLLPHFAASVTALSNYDAEPIPKDKSPKVMTIWCEDGVCHSPSDPRPEPYPKGHALFLLDNRTDFGPNRWDEYLDVDKMEFRHMPGNHFSMIHGDLARILANYIREALGEPRRP